MQGSGGVFRCLQERREELSYECRSWLFHSEVRMAKDGDAKHSMKQACSYELKFLCPGLPPALCVSSAASNCTTKTTPCPACARKRSMLSMNPKS